MSDEISFDFNFFGSTNRVLVLNSDIDSSSATKLVDGLLAAEGEGDEPITLLINCDGGEAISTIMIMDSIRALNVPVIGIVTGWAASGGLYVLEACDKRMMTENSFLFWHQMISGAEDIKTKAEVLKFSKKYDLISDKFDTFLKMRAKINATNWKKYFLSDNDIWFDANQAIELNLIDQIVDFPKPYKKFKNDID